MPTFGLTVASTPSDAGVRPRSRPWVTPPVPSASQRDPGCHRGFGRNAHRCRIEERRTRDGCGVRDFDQDQTRPNRTSIARPARRKQREGGEKSWTPTDLLRDLDRCVPTIPSRGVGPSSGTSTCLPLVNLKPKAARTPSYEVSIGGCPQFPHSSLRPPKWILNATGVSGETYTSRNAERRTHIWMRRSFVADF
jgi:hypothetical protein